MNSQNIVNESQEERQFREWTQAEYATAMRYLLNKGYTNSQIVQPESRILPPLVAMWKVNSHVDGRKQALWVITGDVPNDHVIATVAPTAREAMRHFSLSWQLKSANLEAAAVANRIELGSPAVQREVAQSLQIGAERLYKVVTANDLWPED